MIYRGLIVGQHFRKGGRIIQSALAGGQSLMLRPDPYGQETGTPHQDAAAVAVYISIEEDTYLKQGADVHNLAQELLSCGLNIEELVDEGEFHLGYAARSTNKELVKKNADGQHLIGADQLLHHMTQPYDSTLEWGPNGEPLIKLEIKHPDHAI